MRRRVSLSIILHVKTVGCVADIASSSLPERVQVSQVRLACKALSAAKLVPASAVPPEWSVTEGVRLLTAGPATNEALMKALWLSARDNAALRPYVDMVACCWLLCPAESGAESMGSVLKDVFAPKRQLRHENAAKELLIRWNGPAVGHVEGLVKEAQRANRFHFTRQGQRHKSILGLVIKKQMSKGHVSSIFK